MGGNHSKIILNFDVIKWVTKGIKYKPTKTWLKLLIFNFKIQISITHTFQFILLNVQDVTNTNSYWNNK